MPALAVDLPTLSSDPKERSSSSLSSASWSEYNFEWLFDKDSYDHLPIEEQLHYYQKRNLKTTKFYKTAVKIFGAPQSRTRLIIAKPKESSDNEDNYIPTYTETQPINARLKPTVLPEKLPVIEQALARAKTEKENIQNCHDWIKERKAFRKNLDSMGLQEDWLSNKPHKTPLEQRVLMRMIEERTRRPPTPPPVEEDPLEAVLQEAPVICRSTPLAVKIIEKFLQKHKMRLIDLFQSVDKDKSWTVSRQEFRQAIKQAKIPISDVLLEDLILTLDIDLNDELDYLELAKGMGLWKIEKRESKRQLVNSSEALSSPVLFSKISGYDSPEMEPQQEEEPAYPKTKPSSASKAKSRSDLVREKSAKSTSSTNTHASSSSSQLEPPPPDMRPERKVLTSDEEMLDLRKRNKVSLSNLTGRGKGKLSEDLPHHKMMIKTGEPLVDKHLLPSTLTGSTGELMDKFRQQKYKEYLEICQMCEERQVPFTQEVLEKVILFPGEKPHNVLEKKLRQPAVSLVSKGFYKAPSITGSAFQAGSPDHRHITTKSTLKIKPKPSKTRKVNIVGGKEAYLSKSVVMTSPKKMHLSTGRAVVSKKVECWMTFEEYEGLTSSPESMTTSASTLSSTASTLPSINTNSIIGRNSRENE